MMSLLLALALSQSPLDPAVPPPPPVAQPLPADLAPPGQTDVDRYAAFVEQHLMSLEASPSAYSVHVKGRMFKLLDADFTEAFVLVPSAQLRAEQAQAALRTSLVLQVVALSLTGAGLALSVLAPLTSVALPLLVVALGLLVPALVLSLVAVPFALSGTQGFMRAVAEYNVGLTRLRPPTFGAPPG